MSAEAKPWQAYKRLLGFARPYRGLLLVAEKLYRRNPREWRKAGQPGLDAALARLFSGTIDFPELEGRREGKGVDLGACR